MLSPAYTRIAAESWAHSRKGSRKLKGGTLEHGTFSKKIKQITLWPRVIPLLGTHTQQVESRGLRGDGYSHLTDSIVHNNPVAEATLVPSAAEQMSGVAESSGGISLSQP